MNVRIDTNGNNLHDDLDTSVIVFWTFGRVLNGRYPDSAKPPLKATDATLNRDKAPINMVTAELCWLDARPSWNRVCNACAVMNGSSGFRTERQAPLAHVVEAVWESSGMLSYCLRAGSEDDLVVYLNPALIQHVAKPRVFVGAFTRFERMLKELERDADRMNAQTWDV